MSSAIEIAQARSSDALMLAEIHLAARAATMFFTGRRMRRPV
ncbi:hypothetical protein [Rhodopila sp.]